MSVRKIPDLASDRYELFDLGLRELVDGLSLILGEPLWIQDPGFFQLSED